MWHGPRWNLLNHVTKNGNRGHMTEVQYVYEVQYIGTQTYLTSATYPRTQSLLWAGVMYLKDRSPYLNSSFPCSESQNIIEVNLLGTYSTINTYLKIYLSILLSLIHIPRSISYKYP